MREPAIYQPLNKTCKRIGMRLFHRRQELGWSQRKVAEKAGLSVSFLCDVENGKRRISADRLYRVAKALQVDMTYLFERAL